MRKYALEIFDVTNTTKQAAFPTYVILSGTFVRELNGEDYIEFTVNRREALWSILAHRMFVRLVDTTVVPVTYRSFRIVSLRNERTNDNKLLGTVRAEHIKYDLAAQVHPAAEEIIEQTPLTHLTKILDGSGFTVGTVTPTDRVSIVYSYNTRLFDLEQVRQKTDYDLIFNEDLSVDLTTQGSATTAAIRFKRNLSSIRRTIDRLAANIMYGLGGEGNLKQVMTIAEATHRITAINSGAGIITLDSRKVVSSAGSLTFFYVEKPNGTFVQIIDSNKDSGGGYDYLTLSSVAALVVGDKIKIRTDSDSTARLEYIPDKASRDAYGDVDGVYRNEAIQEIQNLVGPFASSALSGTYTAGLCEGWDLVGEPTVSENTNIAFIKNGEKSQKVMVGAMSAPSNAPAVSLVFFGPLTGAYKYKKTWRTVDGETLASPASATINPSTQEVTVGRNETVPSTHIDSWRIYRTKASGSIYYFVADVPAATSSYQDNKPDSSLFIEEPATSKAAGGQGIERTFTAITDKEYASIVWVYVETGGSVRVELRTGTNFFPDENIESAKRATPIRAQTTLWVVTIQGLIASGTSGAIRIVAHEGAATFYVDAAMVVENAYAPAEGTFIADNSATTLWYETYDALQDAKDPQLTYDIEGIDLFEYDKAGYSGDEITPGDVIKVADEELNINLSLRCVKKTADLLEPWRARFEISNAPNRITKQIEFLKAKETAVALAVINRAVRLSQQVSLQRAVEGTPVIEFAELEA